MYNNQQIIRHNLKYSCIKHFYAYIRSNNNLHNKNKTFIKFIATIIKQNIECPLIIYLNFPINQKK